MVEEGSLRIRTLPELKLLRISNLTTFQHDLNVRPLVGMNVIFGGNYCGKTTIVNAIKFGLFGLTLNRTNEEVSARYFASRIKMRERNSLDVIASFMLGKRLVTAKRTLYSSGSGELDVQIVDAAATPSGGVIGSFSTSHDYQGALCEMMGLDSEEEVEFVLNLLLADEDRHTILWHEDCERMVLKLLIPQQEYAQLGWLEREIEKKKSEVDTVSTNAQAVAKRIDQEETVARFLESNADRLKLASSDEVLQRMAHLRSQRDALSEQLQKLRGEMANALEAKSSKLKELAMLESEKNVVVAKIDSIRIEKYKAILRSGDPEGIHIVKYLIYEKRCPFCEADMGAAVTERETNHLCVFCGNEIGAPHGIHGIDELNKAIEDEEKHENQSKQALLQTKSEIDEIDAALKGIEAKAHSVQEEEYEVLSGLRQLKETEDLEQQALVVGRELQSVREKIKEDNFEHERLNKSLEKLRTELMETQQLLEKGSDLARNKMSEVFARVNTQFAKFVRGATNGELEAELSPDMLPSLKGRKIFEVDDVSQFERMVLDAGFRIAVISCLAETAGLKPLIVFETPDDIADESYLRHLARTLVDFGRDLSILVTSSNTTFTKALLEDYDSAARKLRLLDLSVSGTMTQKSYYVPLITQWMG
jgi:DNA repair exonuclease SbcCD ATPase subunit